MNETIAMIEDACTALAQANYDAEVKVTAVDEGTFVFTLIDEDGDQSAAVTAYYVGTFAGSDLWSFCDKGVTPDSGIVATLQPAVIVGILTL